MNTLLTWLTGEDAASEILGDLVERRGGSLGHRLSGQRSGSGRR